MLPYPARHDRRNIWRMGLGVYLFLLTKAIIWLAAEVLI
jgi:hypothetical protein